MLAYWIEACFLSEYPVWTGYWIEGTLYILDFMYKKWECTDYCSILYRLQWGYGTRGLWKRRWPCQLKPLTEVSPPSASLYMWVSNLETVTKRIRDVDTMFFIAVTMVPHWKEFRSTSRHYFVLFSLNPWSAEIFLWKPRNQRVFSIPNHHNYFS